MTLIIIPPYFYEIIWAIPRTLRVCAKLLPYAGVGMCLQVACSQQCYAVEELVYLHHCNKNCNSQVP